MKIGMPDIIGIHKKFLKTNTAKTDQSTHWLLEFTWLLHYTCSGTPVIITCQNWGYSVS